MIDAEGSITVLSPLLPLVGRAAELGQIALALDAAAGGTARAVALAGEGGVGKSRLAEECIALARERGFSTLHAVASPLHADLHYGVVVDALRPLMRTVEFGGRTSLVEGLPDGASALVMKVHHALTDGIGGIQLAQHVVDLDRRGTRRPPSSARRCG